MVTVYATALKATFTFFCLLSGHMNTEGSGGQLLDPRTVIGTVFPDLPLALPSLIMSILCMLIALALGSFISNSSSRGISPRHFTGLKEMSPT